MSQVTTAKVNPFAEIPTSSIKDGAFGIRRFYEDGAITELAKSIHQSGMIYPLIVQPTPDGKYVLIIGSRRLKAMKAAQFKTVPVVVIPETDDGEKIVLALSENLQREDLTPFEEAWAIMRLVKDFKMGIQGAARRIGRNEDFVRTRIQLLSLPEEVQEMVSRKKISLSHIKALINLKSPEDQIALAQTAVDHKLSDEELFTLVKQELSTGVKRFSKTADLNGKRVELRIDKFAAWLTAIMPKVSGMSGTERHNIQVSLERLTSTLLQVSTIAQLPHQAPKRVHHVKHTVKRR